MPIALEEQGSGEPLVLVHGVGTSRAVWRSVLPLLASAHRATAIDLPGFGESPPAGPGFDLDAVSDLVATGLSGRVAAPFDLVGQSLGGAIAATLALRRPDLVRRLVLVAPAGFAPRPRPLAEAAGLGAQVLLTGRRLAGPPLAELGAARRVLLFGALHDGSRISPEDARMMLTASASATRLREGVAAAVAADLRERAARLEVPLGLIWGERDRVIPISTLRGIAAGRPEAVVETIADAGHVPQIERPAEFIAALERVLERLPAR